MWWCKVKMYGKTIVSTWKSPQNTIVRPYNNIINRFLIFNSVATHFLWCKGIATGRQIVAAGHKNVVVTQKIIRVKNFPAHLSRFFTWRIDPPKYTFQFCILRKLCLTAYLFSKRSFLWFNMHFAYLTVPERNLDSSQKEHPVSWRLINWLFSVDTIINRRN